MAHSSNLIIGSTFNSAQGDFHIHNRDSESGLHTLRLGVSLGAIHDSAERFPPPNCHPDTRKAVRQVILDWIQSESVASSFFWLYGPAGAGKTAILQAIAEFLCSPSGSGQNFGGSFFFSREKLGHDQGRFLFSTIAYQLALNVPGLRQHVNRIMELNPTLHTKSMDVQLKALILNAFQHLSPLPQRSYLVIIDGLDECNDKAIQQLILRLLCETIAIHKLPLRFLIGSRPESHIRASFDQESLYTITQRVVLDETFNPGRDIRVFLRDGFAKICADKSISSHVEQPWPREGVIDLLVQRSSGQFIYAATVLKFVGADFCSPTKQLALVLKSDLTAFSDLDQLYTQILSVYPSTVNIVEILGIIIASNETPPEVIEDILGMEKGELKLVLRGLSSLMEDEMPFLWPIPCFAHASFGDYLFDSSRSGPFHVNRQEYENQVTIRSFALIMQLIRSWRMSSIQDVLAATWYHFTSRLPYRFSRSPKEVKEAIVKDINDFVREFWTSSDGADGTMFFAMIRLLKILHECFDISGRLANLDRSDHEESEFRAKFKVMFDGYREIFDQLLPDVIVQNGMSMQGMLDLYMSGFLRDRLGDRSEVSYWDPMLQHIYICRHFLSLLDRSNAFQLCSQTDDLANYVELHFYGHLCAATTVFFNAPNISDDHPAVEILRDLETTTYCVKNLSVFIMRLLRCIIRVILRWADMLNCHLKGVAVSQTVSNMDLMERVCHLTNKIYREMLSIMRCEVWSVGVIIMDGNDIYITQRNPLDQLSWSRHCLRYTIVPSWYLLSNVISQKDGILCSFTSFITTPELSGPLHISPVIYHTQITEYSLRTIYQPDANWCSGSDWSFREHLSCALPTNIIFRLLRSITSDRLIGEYSAELILEIIVNWLQGLGSKRPGGLYDRFQDDLVRYKALHQSSSPSTIIDL